MTGPLRRLARADGAPGAGVAGRMALASAAGVGAAGASVGLAATSAWLIVRAAERPPVLHLMVAIVAVRAFGLGRGVLRYAERLAGHDAALRLLTRVRTGVVARLARVLPSSRLPGRADLLARFVADVDSTLDLWVRVVLPSVVTLCVMVGVVVGAALLSPAAAVVIAAGAAVPVVAVLGLAPRQASAQAASARAVLATAVLGALDGAVELRVNGAASAAVDEVRDAAGELAALERRSVRAVGAIGATTIASTGAALLAVWSIAARAVGRGHLDAPGFAVLVLLPLAVHELVSLLTPALVSLPTLTHAARRTVQVLDAEPAVVEASHPRPVPSGPLGLELRGVVLGWDAAAPLTSPTDLDVPAGAHVVLRGPSGSGKSTLAATLVRFIDPLAGAVVLRTADGPVPAAAVAADDLRRAVGWAAQDAHVFDSTIAANLRLARPEADDTDLWAALDAAALGDFVRRLPDRLETMVGEHGRQLSGGERQRLTVARLMLADHRIVVLDEPSEHLDDATARHLLADTLAALRDRTVIVLTHRADQLANCPVVLDLASVRSEHSM